MNLENIGTQLLFTTVPLWVENNDGSQSSGTGFFYTVQLPDQGASVPFLATSHHVVANAKRMLLEVVEADSGMPKRGSKIRVEVDGQQFRKFVDEKNDLALLPIAPVLNQFEKAGKSAFYRSIDPSNIPDQKVVNDLGAIEEVTFIGYPSGIYDAENSSPIVRKGITASPIWNNFKGAQAFLIDAGVFPGSSGSPVFIYNQGSYATNQGITVGTRLFFIGIISETMIAQGAERSEVFLGLGKVVKSQELKVLAERVVGEVGG